MLLTIESKKTYRAIILLNEMINGSHTFLTEPVGDDRLLEPLFADLRANGYVISSGGAYGVTGKGRQVYDNFMQRYNEFLRIYDVFSFVDLEKGEFAFARYYDFDTDDQWADFVDDERFDDLRIAVAQFKKLDPTEIVFMSFINEERFDTTSLGWQQNLMTDDIWTEIEAIVSTAIKPDEVGMDAMEDMVRQGTDLMMDLLKEENRQREDEQYNNPGGETVVYETVEYYEPYYDPWYVSPIWFVPLFLW